MKIAMIGQKGIPARYGGVEKHVEELSTELVKKGHQVLVYSRSWYSPKNIKNYRGIRLVHIPTIHTKHLDAIIHTFLSTIHAILQKPDIIHYHGVGPSLLSFIPRILPLNCKVVATFHCIDRYHQKWNRLAKFILALGEWTVCKFPNHTIAISKFIKNYCVNEYGKNAVYIPNGARMPKKEPADLLREWNLQPKKYVFMAARLVKHKGAHYLIEAWKRAKENNPELLSQYKLVIAGGSVFTDKYVETLKERVKTDESIILTGWVKGKKLDALYTHAALLVHPSENEGLPLTVLTAMSAGIPALVSDITEHKELIEDSRFWFMNTNPNSLAEKIVDLLGNASLLKEGAIKNLINAEDNFAWPLIAKQTIELYESLLPQKNQERVVRKIATS